MEDTLRVHTPSSPRRLRGFSAVHLPVSPSSHPTHSMSTPVPSAISLKPDRSGGMLGAKVGAAALFLLFAGLALHVRNEAAGYGPLHRVRAEAMASASASHWVE